MPHMSVTLESVSFWVKIIMNKNMSARSILKWLDVLFCCSRNYLSPRRSLEGWCRIWTWVKGGQLRVDAGILIRERLFHSPPFGCRFFGWLSCVTLFYVLRLLVLICMSRHIVSELGIHYQIAAESKDAGLSGWRGKRAVSNLRHSLKAHTHTESYYVKF